MDLADDNPASNTRMWRLYIGGWVAYLLLLGVPLQLDKLRARQRQHVAMETGDGRTRVTITLRGV